MTRLTHTTRSPYNPDAAAPNGTMLGSAVPEVSRLEIQSVDHDPHNARFQSIVLSSLDAAHNLAWWLTRDEQEAADVVQEACLKAWRFFPGFRGGDGKCWLLSIVRTTVLSRARLRRKGAMIADVAGPEAPSAPRTDEPLAPLLQAADRQTINDAIASLSDTFREVLVLRDVEGLSYAQIATVLGAPVGTVMSRLSRARDAARDALRAGLGKG